MPCCSKTRLEATLSNEQPAGRRRPEPVIGNAALFKQRLQRAVLAEGAVQDAMNAASVPSGQHQVAVATSSSVTA
jgi:hypothetical protein